MIFSKKFKGPKSFTLTPLGGVGEVGSLNMMLYETDATAILVDCGSMFPDDEILGIDLIIPDFTYLETIRHKLKALVLTHGHEDHIGATPYLLKKFNNIPVYGSPFTMGLIEKKLKEHFPKCKSERHVFKPGDTLNIGDWEIQTFFVNHSIIDGCGLALKTAHGNIVHMTDWKIDKDPIGPRMDESVLKKLSRDGVLLYLSDSTNAGRPGATLSESAVAKKLSKLISNHKGRVVITLFASNINRIASLLDCARKTRRTVAFVGRSLKENTLIASQLGKLNLDGVEIVDVEDTKSLKDNKVLLLVTGTQGEPRSILTRIAFNEFRPFRIKRGDLILYSSRIIPGNERNTSRVINELCRVGCDVVYEGGHDIHTSGHAHRDELAWVMKKLKPEFFIPIHGEYRHLTRHAEIAADCGLKPQQIVITQNGNPIHFSGKKVERLEPVPIGRVFIEGESAESIDRQVIRDRRHLAKTGIVVCSMMIDRQSGEILRGPEILSLGFSDPESMNKLLEGAKKNLLSQFEEINNRAKTDLLEMQEEVRITLRRYFNRETGKKPVVIPIVQEV